VNTQSSFNSQVVVRKHQIYQNSKSKNRKFEMFHSRKADFYLKLEIMVKKFKLGSIIQIVLKNPNFAQKSKFCSKIQNFLKNPNFAQTCKFCSKSKFFSKIHIFLKNPHFSQKSKFCSIIVILLRKIKFLTENLDSTPKSRFLTINDNLRVNFQDNI